MDGMDNQLALSLSKIKVVSMEDLAELAIDELMEVEGMTEERAGELIMTARAPWFADEAEEEVVEEQAKESSEEDS